MSSCICWTWSVCHVFTCHLDAAAPRRPLEYIANRLSCLFSLSEECLWNETKVELSLGEKEAKRKMAGYSSITINEQNFPEFSLELFSEIFSALLKHTAVFSLRLTGLKILQNKHMGVHTHPHSPSLQGRPLFFQPRREWWLSLSPQSKRGHWTPISFPITLPDSFIVLVLHNFLSPVIPSASGSCCATRTEVWRASLRRHSWLKWSSHIFVLLSSASSHKIFILEGFYPPKI